jgi:polyhydroxyalkanoate synthase subunit PhaC
MSDSPAPSDIFTEMLRIQGEAARQVLATFAPAAVQAVPGEEAIDAMGAAMLKWQEMWLGQSPPGKGMAAPPPPMADPAGWLEAMRSLASASPFVDPAQAQELTGEWLGLWESILAQYREHPGEAPNLPRKDRRFSDPKWREQPVFALIHQTYLLLAERIAAALDNAGVLDEGARAQLGFATRAMIDAMSPANFPLMNPVVLERTIATAGENLARGMEHLAHDLEAGQLTHTDTSQFRLGENIAATPGKVIYECELFQLIQYTPVTEEVLETPLLIFPPWINRFYILDLNPEKSFVKWAVDQGISVLIVSWRSADASLAHIGWDDYIRAQMQAIDVVRERLDVPSVHTIGYCVAGTNLAATLAVLARRGEAAKVSSATFFTAQVDFAHAGDLAVLVDEGNLELIRRASEGGYFDGRYMAATFNMLRGGDLIWNYVVNHYLLGEDYPAFDLLYWNGDVTNLPLEWHEAYLKNCYRDNLLVVPDALAADGTPIDLRLVETPSYVQAGREDHIAPPESVWQLGQVFSGPVRFVLAGSGHIAGVVNPPSSGKYQHWIGPQDAPSLAAFIAAAEERKGSWWPDWLVWIESQGNKWVKAGKRRKPGSKSNPAIEDAPGRYVRMR